MRRRDADMRGQRFTRELQEQVSIVFVRHQT
jgi:hypothetical protein